MAQPCITRLAQATSLRDHVDAEVVSELQVSQRQRGYIPTLVIPDCPSSVFRLRPTLSPPWLPQKTFTTLLGPDVLVALDLLPAIQRRSSEADIDLTEAEIESWTPGEACGSAHRQAACLGRLR